MQGRSNQLKPGQISAHRTLRTASSRDVLFPRQGRAAVPVQCREGLFQNTVILFSLPRGRHVWDQHEIIVLISLYDRHWRIMNNCLMSRLYMQSSAFAWLFSLYCKILLIPANRINRKHREANHMCGIYTTTRWLWSAYWKQCQFFKLLHFPADSSSNHLSWLPPFRVQLLDTDRSPPRTKGFSHLRNIGANARISTEITVVWSGLRLGYPPFWFSVTGK